MKAIRRDNIIENFHGVKVADPYRWLEDPHSPDTQAWIEGQNEATYAYLNSIPVRQEIKERLTEVWDYPKLFVPRKKANRYFFQKNDGLQNQPVFYVQDTPDSEPAVVIDPNEFSEDGTVALTNTSISEDGKLVAYAISRSGSDWQEIRIREIDGGNEYDETIQFCKFTSLPWLPDNSGFFYTRFPEPGSVPPEQGSFNSKIFFHRIGTPQSEDQLIYERPDAPELGFSAHITEDKKYMLLMVSQGTDPRNRVYYRELGSDGPFVHLLDDADALYYPVCNVDDVFYFRTNLEAPKGRIIAIDLKKPEREHWQTVIPEAEDVMSSVSFFNGQFVIAYMHHAHHQVKVYNVDGTHCHDIELPTIGALAGASGEHDQPEMFVAFSSYLYPTTIFSYNLETRELKEFHKPELSFNPDDYETKQVFYASKDGTQVPMFVTHKKGIKMDGSNPALLYGYGGFNIPMLPGFSASTLVWLEYGGVYAVACMRGGSEYGEAWHRAGMLESKQNVFDDFISAGEWLIEKGYTSKEKLAITGGSNGGLLVAACMVQRPDLYGAVVCRVPVIDMLRYHLFTVGRYWVGEYGNAEKSAEQFAFMYRYSPLHNIRQAAVYPATLVMTADTDDRVVPAHAYKFTATLQDAHAGETPILCRVEMKAGHGAGKPTTKVIEETADMYAFLYKALKMGPCCCCE